MNRFKKLLSVLLVLAITLSMAASLAGCTGGSDANNTETTAGKGSADNGTYNVLVQSAAGMPMEGIDVYIFADSTLGDMKGAVATDASGKANVTLPKSDKYANTLSGVTGDITGGRRLKSAPRSTRKEQWETYKAAVKMMFSPMLVVICAIVVIYMIMWFLFTFF